VITGVSEEKQQLDSMKPLLTIAIPTYNRARNLRELLSLLFDQLATEPRVELIVSDNASSDETPAVIEEFRQLGHSFRYIRNETNTGPDGNILQCFEQARGKYVWIFGDDDILAADAIGVVTTCLDADEYDLVCVDCFAYRDSQIPKALRSRQVPTLYTDLRKFVRKFHLYFTFISGNIVNKDRVLARRPPDFSTLIGTGLVQLGWIYTMLNGFVRGLHIQEKLVGMGLENHTTNYTLLEIFGPNIKKVTWDWLQSENLRHTVMHGALQRYWPFILLDFRRSGANIEAEASPSRILGAVFKDDFRYWAFVYPVLKLPYGLAACWLMATRILNRIDKAFGFILLN
jgi:glycosyltransferase involved in cell wall biosynthesis